MRFGRTENLLSDARRIRRGRHHRQQRRRFEIAFIETIILGIMKTSTSAARQLARQTRNKNIKTHKNFSCYSTGDFRPSTINASVIRKNYHPLKIFFSARPVQKFGISEASLDSVV